MMSPEIGELAKALAKAQGEISYALKDSLNPHFKFKYADLAAVWGAARGPLSSNGLAVVQLIEAVSVEAKSVRVVTMLTHASGQWIKSTIDMPIADARAQSVGSAITYARRYSLASIVGIVADEDDDGNAAQGLRPVEQPKPAAAPRVINPPATVSKDTSEAQAVKAFKERLGIPYEALEKHFKIPPTAVPLEELRHCYQQCAEVPGFKDQILALVKL